MRGFDVFVLPSLAEGISNTILEAMATGLPVLATRVGGNEELVAEGHTGALVAAGDVEALAQGLVNGCADADHTRSLGAAGRQRVVDKFSLPAMVDAYKGLYDRLLAASRR
jgi:glycosyltransferase involved in cell wall biosynthesis